MAVSGVPRHSVDLPGMLQQDGGQSVFCLCFLSRFLGLMKYSRLAGLILSVSMVGVGALAVNAQAINAQTPNRSTPRPTTLSAPPSGLSDRVLVTSQSARLMRGKQSDPYVGPVRFAKIQYPQVRGIPSAALLSKVQASVSLKAVVGRSLEELRTELQEAYWLTDIDYEVNYNQNFLLDLTYTIAGVGAYPSQFEKHVTVDLKTGLPLRSYHLFKQDRLGAIAALVDKAMQVDIDRAIAAAEKDGEDIRSQINQARFRVKHVDNFSLGEKGVTFRYDFGFPHVIKALQPQGEYFFTYAELKSYIRSNGPIGVLIP
jgi:hypothetical protein